MVPNIANKRPHNFVNVVNIIKLEMKRLFWIILADPI